MGSSDTPLMNTPEKSTKLVYLKKNWLFPSSLRRQYSLVKVFWTWESFQEIEEYLITFTGQSFTKRVMGYLCHLVIHVKNISKLRTSSRLQKRRSIRLHCRTDYKYEWFYEHFLKNKIFSQLVQEKLFDEIILDSNSFAILSLEVAIYLTLLSKAYYSRERNTFDYWWMIIFCMFQKLYLLLFLYFFTSTYFVIAEIQLAETDTTIVCITGPWILLVIYKMGFIYI